MLRVGILGTGAMGRIHAASFKQIQDVQVTAFADENELKGRETAQQFNVRFEKSADSLINDPAIDIINICLPTPLHKKYVIKALKTGKHIFCEKPIARTLPDAEEIANLVEKSKSTFMVGHVCRFFPDIVTIKNLIDQGKVGKVGVARSSRTGHFPQGEQNWYRTLSMSGGVVLDLIIHDFDFMNWFFGKPKRVFARGLSKSGIKDFDYALVVIRYKNGVIAHVEGSWAEPSGFGYKVEISGDQGLLEYSSYDTNPLFVNLQSTDFKSTGVAIPESPLAEDPYTSELRHFIDCVKNKKKPLVTTQDAVNALKVSLAALESIETGQPINLE